MQSTHFLLFLGTLIMQTLADLTSSTTSASASVPFIPVNQTSEFVTSITPTAVATPGTLLAESKCSGNSTLTNFCPACDGSVISYGQFGAYDVNCNTVYANVIYYEDIQNATVLQYIQACMDLEGCYSPVVSPDGKCLLAVIEPGHEPILAAEDRYAVLEPRFTGFLPPPSISEISISASTTSHSKPTKSLKHVKTCSPSDISCPQCDGARVKDTFNVTYKVLCDNTLYADHHESIQRYLTPQGCMAECDNFPGCGGSVSWPEGNCELFDGDDVFPQSKEGYTAFLSVNLSYTAPPQHLSAYPTGPAGGEPTSTGTMCDKDNVKCPACDHEKVSDGLDATYCVRCDAQPICAVMEGKNERDTPNSCMEQCDRDPGCLAAIFEKGECAICQGTLESMVDYPLPHDFVVFVREEGMTVSPVTTGSTAMATSHHTAWSYTFSTHTWSHNSGSGSYSHETESSTSYPSATSTRSDSSISSTTELSSSTPAADIETAISRS